MRRIYLDHAATSPVREEVREAMAPWLGERFGNPSSLHAEGRGARSALEDARERVATALGADPSEILFVRGGTESDNLAILGRSDWARARGEEPRIVVSAIEHRAVLSAAAAVEQAGGTVVRLGVSPDGEVDEDALSEALEAGAHLVSIMWVNNEVGIRLPVERLAKRCRDSGVPLHTDAVQAVGKLPLDLARVPVDLLTATGHKIQGPRGTGILFRRRGIPLQPRLFGGGQEESLRPGTQDVAGAVGMAEAVELACREQEEESRRLEDLRDELAGLLRQGIEDLTIHGEHAPRAPHILNVGIPGAELESLLVGLDLAGLSVSSGSACSSGAVRASHVLVGLYGPGVGDLATLRFSLGGGTDAEAVRQAADITASTVRRVRGSAAARGA